MHGVLNQVPQCPWKALTGDPGTTRGAAEIVERRFPPLAVVSGELGAEGGHLDGGNRSLSRMRSRHSREASFVACVRPVPWLKILETCERAFFAIWSFGGVAPAVAAAALLRTACEHEEILPGTPAHP
jgi:hypothetical protein